MTLLRRLDEALAPLGLTRLGCFHPEADEGFLSGRGLAGGTLVLVGNAGPGFWRTSGAAIEELARAGHHDPLDDWSRAAITPLADELGAGVIFPFDGPPWAPFPTWASRCATLHRSPLGIAIHPRYGLWHAFRAAFHFPETLEDAEETAAHPCESCSERPCMSACPVRAFTSQGYDVEACRRHLETPSRACWSHGCLARVACPVGAEERYEDAQMRFHMRAFTAAKRP